jgi:hypothetical protein
MLNNLVCLILGLSGLNISIIGSVVDSQPTTLYGLISSIICLIAQFLLYYFGVKKGEKNGK